MFWHWVDTSLSLKKKKSFYNFEVPFKQVFQVIKSLVEEKEVFRWRKKSF